ncbi:hypothetical protein BW686_14275 [Pseudomonas syringae]|uniref:DUF1534 domain-containing protein n=1 Tax=Pseudomonas syringae TaxID=317 RepID=A0A244EQ89_PSESX|nr:hypothetical protein BW686_14275 [Pseudomonas syringae]
MASKPDAERGSDERLGITIVPMLRVGAPFVTLCVTILRRTARSRSDAERGSDENTRPPHQRWAQRPISPLVWAFAPGNTRRPVAHRRWSINVQ